MTYVSINFEILVRAEWVSDVLEVNCSKSYVFLRHLSVCSTGVSIPFHDSADAKAGELDVACNFHICLIVVTCTVVQQHLEVVAAGAAKDGGAGPKAAGAAASSSVGGADDGQADDGADDGQAAASSYAGPADDIVFTAEEDLTPTEVLTPADDGQPPYVAN